MDKKKVRKCFSKAHKAAEPITTRLSHKDMRHVNDSMQAIDKGLRSLNGFSAVKDFNQQFNLSKDGKEWFRESNGSKSGINTQDMMTILKDAKKYVKKNY